MIFGAMTPEMWEAFVGMSGVPIITDAYKDCCVCGDEIDKNEVYLEFMDMTAAVHIPCADKLTAKLEERFYSK